MARPEPQPRCRATERLRAALDAFDAANTMKIEGDEDDRAAAYEAAVEAHETAAREVANAAVALIAIGAIAATMPTAEPYDRHTACAWVSWYVRTPLGRAWLGRFIGEEDDEHEIMATARSDAYLAALTRAHQLAPEDSPEEQHLDEALVEACDRLGLDLDDVQLIESNRLRAEGLLS